MATMTMVASKQKSFAGKPVDAEWKVMGVYFDRIETYYQEAIVDVVKVTGRTAKMKNVPISSISNTAWKAKVALENDPHNMKLINNLGCVYLEEGQHEQCLNVMMRGWKRIGEIPDPRVRFRFLMKLGELSMGYWKYRQGLAIFRDIEEPSEKKDLKSYLILGTQLWCNNGDLQQSLKFFHLAIDQEPLQVAVRIFAVLALDLKKVGGYEAAKSTIEQLVAPNGNDSDLRTLDLFVQQVVEQKKLSSPEQRKQRFIIACVTIVVLWILGVLWYVEQQSLTAIKAIKS